MLKTKFLIMDVDGTLTDGRIYMGKDGELFKAFDIKDGCGIHDILPQYNIVPVVITARDSQIVKNRCREIGIVELYQGCSNKLVKILEILRKAEYAGYYDLSNCAYIGDDLSDLESMRAIKESGGIVGCPADATDNIRIISSFISKKNGGRGAVRDFIEYLIKNI